MPNNEMERLFNDCYKAATNNERFNHSKETLEALDLNEAEIDAINNLFNGNREVSLTDLAKFVVNYNREHYQKPSDLPHPLEGLAVELEEIPN